MASRVRIRRDLASVWASANPVLAAAELGYETNTGRIKAGDGITLWNALDYIDDAAKAFTTSSLAAHSIDAGAHPNYVHTSALAPVAFSGSFEDLEDQPVISAALEDLTDVEITGVSNGQVIVYNAVTGKWVNETVLSTGGGGAATNLGYVTASRLLTSSTGTDVTLPLATTADAGLMAASDKAKVDSAASIALSAALAIALG